MPIFKIEKGKVKQLPLKKDGFGDEFQLRDFFAENLEDLLGVRYIAKEYQIPNGRIDTLGLDEADSPVIIEYKWKEHQDVLSQGLFYLEWLVKNKPHFNLLVKNKLGPNVEVNWDQPRVILIAQGFNQYIRSAVQVVSGVELKSYTLYEGDVLHIENEYSIQPSRPVKKQQQLAGQQAGTEYDLNYHLKQTSPQLQMAFNNLRERILQLPEIEEVAGQKTGITYRTTKSFTRFEFKKNSILVLLRQPSYVKDTNSLVKDVTTFRWGFLGAFKFIEETDLDYLFELLRESYNSTL